MAHLAVRWEYAFILASGGILNFSISSSLLWSVWTEGSVSVTIGTFAMANSVRMPFLHKARAMVLKVALLEMVDRFPLTSCGKENTKTRFIYLNLIKMKLNEIIKLTLWNSLLDTRFSSPMCVRYSCSLLRAGTSLCIMSVKNLTISSMTATKSWISLDNSSCKKMSQGHNRQHQSNVYCII